MSLVLKTQRGRFDSPTKIQATVNRAINVKMDEVVYNDEPGNKTFVTDGLATCVAVALYGGPPTFAAAFTHMSSESTPEDDRRKTLVLTQMLTHLLEHHPHTQINMVLSPAGTAESHLIRCIEEWAQDNHIACKTLNIGGDSAVFDIDSTGKALMISTSLRLEEDDAHPEICGGKGIVFGKSELRANELHSQLISKPDEPTDEASVRRPML